MMKMNAKKITAEGGCATRKCKIKSAIRRIKTAREETPSHAKLTLPIGEETLPFVLP